MDNSIKIKKIQIKDLSQFFSRKNILIATILCVIFIGISIFYFLKATNNVQKKTLKQVSKHMVLPTDESPAIATVSDKNKLKQEAFFSQAENGDVVLLYQKAQKAILYRPNIDRIIEVAPFILPKTASIASPQPSVENKKPTIAIYNGTNVTGLAKKIGRDLKEANPNLDIILTATAQKQTYTKTAIIDISGTNAALVKEIAGTLNGEVLTSIPKNEQKPTTDILVIAGE